MAKKLKGDFFFLSANDLKEGDMSFMEKMVGLPNLMKRLKSQEIKLNFTKVNVKFMKTIALLFLQLLSKLTKMEMF